MTENVDAKIMQEVVDELGFSNPKILSDGRIAALVTFMFTTAIITMTKQGYRVGYEDRWCFHTEAGARKALDAWDGTGEPQGWHRHPATGRRIDEDGKMHIHF